MKRMIDQLLNVLLSFVWLAFLLSPIAMLLGLAHVLIFPGGGERRPPGGGTGRMA